MEQEGFLADCQSRALRYDTPTYAARFKPMYVSILARDLRTPLARKLHALEMNIGWAVPYEE